MLKQQLEEAGKRVAEKDASRGNVDRSLTQIIETLQSGLLDESSGAKYEALFMLCDLKRRPLAFRYDAVKK